jgi:hypothetical protein
MGWEVQIAGDKPDLHSLSESLTDGAVRILEKEGNYYLLADTFEALTDVDTVRAEAARILQSLSGSSALVLGTVSPFGVGGIYLREPGESDQAFFLVQPAVLQVRGFAPTLVVADEHGNTVTHRPGDPARVHLKNALADPNVAKALRLRGQGELAWVDLYRILEVILDAVPLKDVVAAGWCSETEIRSFRHTANSVGALGDDSRHGAEQTQPPKRPMLLGTARELIDRLLNAWLKS